MSEQLSHHEIHHAHEVKHETSEHHEKLLRESQERAEHSKRHTHEDIEKFREAAEQAAVSVKELNVADSESTKYQTSQSFVNKEIRDMAYHRLLTRARKHLSPSQKLLSGLIHQPVIDDLSEATGKTIARPSGILGGGILAFSGTLLYYYLTKNYGYTYNNFVFIALLLVGFAAGWTLEVLFKLRGHKA